MQDFILQVAADADPAKEGYQASTLYVVLCTAVPIVMGFLMGVLSYAAGKLTRKASRSD